MCKPFTDYKDPLDGANHEIMSGISALHMPPQPILEDQIEKDSPGYLSDTDAYVKHAIEHLREARKQLVAGLRERNRLVDAVDRLLSVTMWPDSSMFGGNPNEHFRRSLAVIIDILENQSGFHGSFSVDEIIRGLKSIQED